MNEKYSEGYVVSVLKKMWQILCETSDTSDIIFNPVRANNIKLKKELCLAAGISPRQLEYFKEKYTKETGRLDKNGVKPINIYFNETISELMEMIETVCECRLIYSATSMDMHILAKHYGYKANGASSVQKFITEQPVSVLQISAVTITDTAGFGNPFKGVVGLRSQALD